MMGISISCDTATLPHEVTVHLACDSGAGSACGWGQRFTGGYIAAHAAAIAAGWLERQTPSGRLFLCPACSGKR